MQCKRLMRRHVRVQRHWQLSNMVFFIERTDGVNIFLSGGKRHHDDVLLRFLAAAQVLLGHLSTLGSHRQVLSADAANAVMERGDQAVAALQRVADAVLASRKTAAGPADLVGSGDQRPRGQPMGGTARLHAAHRLGG